MPRLPITRIKRHLGGQGMRFFLLGALLSLLLSPGNLCRDAERRLQVSRWMWTTEPQVLDSDTFPLSKLAGRKGQAMAQFGIGQSLVMLPADMLSGALFGLEMSATEGKLREMLVCYLTLPLISGLALVFARRICGEFFANSHSADLAALSFALCTSFLIYSCDTQENMLMNLCVLGGIWHGLRWGQNGLARHAAMMASFLGFLLLVRISTIAVVMPMAVAIGLHAWSSRWPIDHHGYLKSMAITGVILAAFVMMDRCYHWYRFGECTHTYAHYMVEKAKQLGCANGFPMGNPFWHGMRSFAFDARKACYLFDPTLFCSALAMVLPLRDGWQLRGLLAASWVALVGTAALYATSDFWHGDVAWGPRHLNVAIMPTVLFGIIAIVSFIGDRPLSRIKAFFKALLIWGFFTQAVALPLYQDLEVLQWKSGYPVSFPPALRVMNVISSACGDPKLWGLDCGRVEVLDLQCLPLQFMPFQVAHKMPGTSTSFGLVVLWCVALTGFLIGLGRWFQRLGKTCLTGVTSFAT